MADGIQPNAAPPMEEILASIRRIIAEEPPVGSSEPAFAEPESGPPPATDLPDDDVLELGAPPRLETPRMPASASVAPLRPAAIAASSPPDQGAASQPATAAEPDIASLVSNTTENASRQALAALSGLSIDPNAAANTLDGLVRELLRPMLKSWLDANLPELVERLVAREIARIGGR